MKKRSKSIGAAEGARVDRISTPDDTAAKKSAAKISENDHKGDSQATFPIVGIVASAGGLDAFKKFFSKLPAESGMAFVLIPHLDPSHKSLMVELLSKLTSLPVVEAEDGMVVQKNSTYIIPPNKFLSISEGALRLSAPPKHRAWQTSIDFFLRSLARDQGERAIGIVLSGTGSHGALGVREIKLAGGMVMAQKPDTAEYGQMPQSAIDTGVIDCVLPPAEMPAELVNYVEQPYLSDSDRAESTPQQSTDLLIQILNLVQTRTKYDFCSYRKPMVLRRIQRRMGLAHIVDMKEYLEFLQQHSDEVTALHKDLLISVTTFFRDPDAYRTLQQEIIPTLLARKSIDLPLRVWVPGCATGEEAYSIAILLFEAIAEEKAAAIGSGPSPDGSDPQGDHPPGITDRATIQIFASDIDADAIEVARAGIYPASIADDVSQERLERFFVTVDDNHFQINKAVRESVVFSRQNLIGDAPFSKLNLVSCRNLLIYLEPELQRKVITLFHFALEPDGYLMLGPSETVGRLSELFETISKNWRIYRRSESTKRELIHIPLSSSDGRRHHSSHSRRLTAPAKSFKDLTEQLILREYAPAAALINRNFEVLYVTGPLVNYLEFPRGELTKELFAMARPGLRTKLRSACTSAARDRTTVVDTKARVKRDAQYTRCSITVRPLTEPKEAEGLILVIFQDCPATGKLGEPADRADRTGDPDAAWEDESRLSRQLEYELKSLSEELQSTIEEKESSNEELKTSNEEIMSVNEELQSVNEELETSKEELQSLNEELNSVNSQLHENVTELSKSTDDLLNLMSSTEIATIFLDKELNIKRFTPPTKSLLNLLASDVGRPFQDIALKFVDDRLLSECQQVLNELNPVEREIETDDSRYFLRRILPYRTTDHVLGGVVITFVDLTQRKQFEAAQREADSRHFEELHETAERLQAILDTAADAIVTFDPAGKIDSVNAMTESLFGYQRDEVIGESIALLIPSLSARSERNEMAGEIKNAIERRVGKLHEAVAKRKDGSLFPVDLAINRVDHLELYTGILRDISHQKQLQTHVLEIAADEQRRIGQELHDGTQQELTGLSLFAGTLCNYLEHAESDSTAARAEWKLSNTDYLQIKKTAAKLSQGLTEANQHVRTLSHGIMPVQIDAEGLRSALTELATDTSEQQKIRCRFEFVGSGFLANNSIATQLYRIAQESLSNAIKHGQADDVLITLSQHSENIVLEVQDNGVGFDPQATSRPASGSDGFGLRIMEYRASMLGGDLRVDRSDQTGTIVRCTVPVTGVLQ